METQQPGHDQPCRLLEYPREIRDLIYTEILLDFPTPNLECLLNRAAYEVNTIVPSIEAESDEENDDSQQEGNIAPAFHREALEFCQQTHQIDTNILLVNRQTFTEAKEIILRRGRFVKVICENVDLCRRLCGTQLCLIDAKYSSLSIMTYNLVDSEDARLFLYPHESEFLLQGGDVDNFCRMVMGDTPLILRRELSPAICHTLEFTTNFHDRDGAPEYLTRAEIHEKILQPFRKHLRGFYSVSLQGSSVGLGGALAATAVQDMTSQFIPDPVQTLSDMEDLHLLSERWLETGCYFHVVLPIFKVIDLCKRAVRHPGMWAAMQSKASDPTSFVKKMLGEAYNSLVVQMRIWLMFPGQISPHAPHTAYFKQTYELCLAAARAFDAPDWRPSTSLEWAMNLSVAQGVYRYRKPCRTGIPLAVGYKAAQRAFELAPGREESETLMECYEQWKVMAVRSGNFIEIADKVLIQNGTAWWSGFRPWSSI